MTHLQSNADLGVEFDTGKVDGVGRQRTSQNLTRAIRHQEVLASLRGILVERGVFAIGVDITESTLVDADFVPVGIDTLEAFSDDPCIAGTGVDDELEWSTAELDSS